MALVTTFATTPLTSALYPPWYQKKLEAWKRGEIDWDTGKPHGPSDDPSSNRDSLAFEKLESSKVAKVLVYLRLDNMPTLLAFMSLLGGTPQALKPKLHPSHPAPTHGQELEDTQTQPRRPIEAHGVRLIELTERDSSVMKVSEVEEYSLHDPVVNTFRTFGRLHNLAVSGEVAVTPESGFAESLVAKAGQQASDLILLPWSETGSLSEQQVISNDSVRNKLETSAYITFVSDALESATCSMAVFVNKNFGGTGPSKGHRPRLSRALSTLSLSSNHDRTPIAPIADRSHHVFMPFFGGADDRAALRLVLQMAENPDVTATIIHFETSGDHCEDVEISASPLSKTNSGRDKNLATTTSTAALPGERDAIFFASLRNSLPAELSSRIVFESIQSPNPLLDVIERSGQEVGQSPRNAGDMVIVGRNAMRAASFAKDTGAAVGEAGRCLGVVAERIIRQGVGASVVVIQARGRLAESSLMMM